MEMPLAPDDIEVIEPASVRPIIIVCDHAGHRVPAELAGLGISPQNLRRHIGWDIGAAAISRELARLLGAKAILNHISRLVIDANRRPYSETSIPEISDGCIIPGNERLSRDQIRKRIALYFLPYHRRIAHSIAAFRRRGMVPALISVHSFTRRLNREDRPWDIGVLSSTDKRLAAPVLDALRRTDLLIGDNQPYSGQRQFGYTVTFHGQRTGLPHVMFEVRQDEIERAEEARGYARLLWQCLQPVLARPELYALSERTPEPPQGLPSWRQASRVSPLA